MRTSLRYAYLHGFASSPKAHKGSLLRERLARFGVDLALPDLNQPSFAQLSYSGSLGAIDAMDDDPARRWCLIGSSMGGYLAARWAELHPERVHRLVLLCPGFDMLSRWPAMVGEAAWARWQSRGSLPLPDGEGVVRSLHWGFVEDARQHPAWPEVPCPTLIVHGRQDAVVPVQGSRAYAASRAHVRLIEVDDDHGLVASAPQIGRAAAEFFGLIC